jgi:allatostatin receptor
MSLDRYLAVCFPVSRVRNERNTIVSILALWLIVLLANIPVFHAHGIREYEHNERNLTSCTFLDDNEFMVHSTFHVSFFTSGYLMPLLFISVLYFLMLLRLWKSNLAQSSESKRGKRRVTRLVLVIVACFAILWLPIQLILLLKSLKMYEYSHLTVALQISAHILAYASSCVNPLLYAFLSQNFRSSFSKVCFLPFQSSSFSLYSPEQSTKLNVIHR